MESLMLFLDAVAILVLVYGALIDDQRPRNARQRSPFRYIEDEVEGDLPPQPKQPRSYRR